jgi:hypothetical protein
MGDPTSPIVCITVAERAMENMKSSGKGLSVNGVSFSTLRFADDIVIMTEALDEMEMSVQELE